MTSPAHAPSTRATRRVRDPSTGRFTGPDGEHAAPNRQGNTRGEVRHPERDLWSRVLGQCIQRIEWDWNAMQRDYESAPERQEHLKRWSREREWLLLDEQSNFQEICQLLGLDPQAVRERVWEKPWSDWPEP